MLGVLLLACNPASEKTSSQEMPHVAFVLNMEDTILDFDANAEQPNKNEIQLILDAAIKAPSGRNMQPYWITFITDYETQMDLALTPEVRPQRGTVLFIYSYPSDSKPSHTDIGISYGYLNAMSQALGYGTHIYSQPAGMLATRGDAGGYGIPDNYVPAEFVLVGKSDTVDAASAATNYPRKPKYNFGK